VLLYEMVSGRRPFARATMAETMAAILRDEPAALAQTGKEVPEGMERVIRHCLEKRADERFQSAHELALDLKAILSGTEEARSTLLAGRPAPGARRPRSRRSVDSLAVLPFENASADPNTEYLSDGITESIINSLSPLPKLKVMARSTVFRYKGRAVDPQEAGRELGVRAVLTGRVLQLGDRLVIKAELVDAADGAQLWGEQYNRQLTDILQVQEEIAREISEKLRLRLSGEEKKRLAKRHTENTEAYQLYLKGRYYWNKRTEEGLRRGMAYFQQAIGKDPAYALAYAGLADCYRLLSSYSVLPSKESGPRAKAAALKALEIDDHLAEAHTSLAYIQFTYDWDLPEAERGFRRALELNSNYATAHQWYSLYLRTMGRFDEAWAEIKRAQELDPLSLIISATAALHFYYTRQSERMMEQARQTIELEPSSHITQGVLGLAYELQGKYEEAIAEYHRAIPLSGGDPEVPTQIARTYAMSGRREEAERVLGEVLQLSQQRYVSPYDIALIYASLGERDQAFAWLEKAYEDRVTMLPGLKVDPRMDNLRADPRFQDLLQRLGFAP